MHVTRKEGREEQSWRREGRGEKGEWRGRAGKGKEKREQK